MRRGVRRPLLALVALVVALGIGYAVRAADSGHGGGGGAPSSPAVSSTAP